MTTYSIEHLQNRFTAAEWENINLYANMRKKPNEFDSMFYNDSGDDPKEFWLSISVFNRNAFSSNNTSIVQKIKSLTLDECTLLYEHFVTK